MYAADLEPLTVSALEHAVKRAAALGGREHVAYGYRLTHGLGGVQQRAGHERCLDAGSDAGLLPAVERGADAQRRNQGGSHVGDGMYDVDRAASIGWLAGKDACASRDEVMVGRLVLQGAVCAVGRD